jgi:hypothetical protein
MSESLDPRLAASMAFFEGLNASSDRARAEQDDALSVLRDLVAQEDARPAGRFNPTIWRAAWARARSLVAEHNTDEEPS